MKKLLIASLVIFGSCKSTETISQFAKSTSTGAAEISRATLGFNQICERYDPASLKKFTDTTVYTKSVNAVVHCPDYKKTDSLMDLINQTLFNYFTMLQAVSDKKLLAYNVDDLVNTLAGIQPQIYPSLSLNTEKITAGKSLLNSILNEPLN